MPLDRLLPLRALTRLLSVSAATIRGWIIAGEFPSPIELPNGRERWRASEVAIWQARLGEPTRVDKQLQQADEPQEQQQDQEQQEVDIDSLSELSQEILQALTEMEDGWHPSRTVAAKVSSDIDHNGGSWRRALRELREAGMIHSGPDGVRLRLGEGPGPPSDLAGPASEFGRTLAGPANDLAGPANNLAGPANNLAGPAS
jgi:predicted DNA-binding transcriptional regulator AlpA